MKTKQDVINELENILERIRYWDVHVDTNACFLEIEDNPLFGDKECIRRWQGKRHHTLHIEFMTPTYDEVNND